MDDRFCRSIEYCDCKYHCTHYKDCTKRPCSANGIYQCKDGVHRCDDYASDVFYLNMSVAKDIV